MRPYHMVPSHIGIIPDGSRRWARQNNVSLELAYQTTIVKLAEWVEYCFKQDFSSISIYSLARDNMERTNDALSPIIKNGLLFLRKYLPEIIAKWNVEVVHAGDKSILPDEACQVIEDVCQFSRMRKTNTHRKRYIYMLIGYSPFDELKHALSQASDPDQYWDHLWVPDTVDVVIRTSGVVMLSNFLPLQSGNARFYFMDALFPDAKLEDVDTIIEQFGKTVLYDM